MDVVSTQYFFVAYLIGGLVLGTAASVLAGRKGLSRQGWGLLGFAGGVLFVLPGIVVLIILVLKPRLEPLGAQPPHVQATPARPPDPAQPPQPASSPPQFQSPPTLQMPVGPQPASPQPHALDSDDAPPQGPQFQSPPTLQMPVGPQPAPPPEPAAADSQDVPPQGPQFQSPPTLQMPVGPQPAPPQEPPAPESGDAPPQGPQFQSPPTLQTPVGPQSTPPLEPAPPLPPCMDRTHGGRVFGDMVDTFEYVRHRA